jgi:hypothetical protein
MKCDKMVETQIRVVADHSHTPYLGLYKYFIIFNGVYILFSATPINMHENVTYFKMQMQFIMS